MYKESFTEWARRCAIHTWDLKGGCSSPQGWWTCTALRITTETLSNAFFTICFGGLVFVGGWRAKDGGRQGEGGDRSWNHLENCLEAFRTHFVRLDVSWTLQHGLSLARPSLPFPLWSPCQTVVHQPPTVPNLSITLDSPLPHPVNPCPVMVFPLLQSYAYSLMWGPRHCWPGFP